MKRGIVLVGVGVAAMGVAALLAVSIEPTESVIAEAPPMMTQQRHTMEDFRNLGDGISYDDAARMLRHVGHEVLRGEPADIPNVRSDASVYMWPNPNGSRIVLVFRGDRLTQKAQVGLD